MNRQIKRLGIALTLCYLVAFVWLNYIQVFRADSLNNHPENTRQVFRDFSRPRGTIETADGTVIARSVPVDDEFERQREYPQGALFAHLTGFFSFQFGAEGLERSYNNELAGQTAEQELRSFADLFVDKERVGNLRTTVRADVQQVARDALGERRGSVVAIDPRTGALLAAWSFPTYDPNPLSSHDFGVAAEARAALEPESSASPIIPAFYRKRFFPGSTFKVVTGSVGLDVGTVTPEEPIYPDVTSYTPPQTTRPLQNFGGSVCGGALFEILARSCNTGFAEMAVEDIGPDPMVAGAEGFGFNDEPPIDLPEPVASSAFPTDFTDRLPALAQAGIGQNDVQATPLQMAMVAASIGNEGRMMAPYVVSEIRDEDGDVFDETDPSVWQTPVPPDVAGTMRQAMVGVVENGTAGSLAIPGVQVGGKTGTAQLGTDPPSSHAWIMGFAGQPGQPAEVAVAVLVEAQPGVSEVTGGDVAGPIARAVMEAALGAPPP